MRETCKRCHGEFLEGKVSATSGLCRDCADGKPVEVAAIKDGGPAFPRTEEIQTSECGNQMHFGSQGMTLRDWFAGMALQGCISSSPDIAPTEKNNAGTFRGDCIAESAYVFADAMLKAREVKP